MQASETRQQQNIFHKGKKS